MASARLLVESRGGERPEWLQDERGLEGLAKFFEWLAVGLKILDDYSIERLGDMLERLDADAGREQELAVLKAETRTLRDYVGGLRMKLDALEREAEP